MQIEPLADSFAAIKLRHNYVGPFSWTPTPSIFAVIRCVHYGFVFEFELWFIRFGPVG